MLLVVPCPSFLVFCAGVLPVVALALAVVQMAEVALRDPVAIVFAFGLLIHVIVYAALLYWLAGLLLRLVSASRFLKGWQGVALAALTVFIVVAAPIYTFDCMDGAAARWCAWFELEAAWWGGTESCGDFPW